ncbi:MAG: F-type H+-transporting ATPase subunit delta [Paracoccaceae bacterium]
MSETASISLGVAARYATAVFDLAQEGKKLAAIENDVNALAAALESSDDFSDLISSPVYSRAEQAGAIAAIAKKMGLNGITTNTLGLMAENRRLFVLPHLVTAIRDLIAEEKGEVTAEITSAKKLTKAQETKLAASLKKAVGKDVIIQATVDEALIGGLVVKVGSQMIDSSIASKLSNLQNAMKEVG